MRVRPSFPGRRRGLCSQFGHVDPQAHPQQHPHDARHAGRLLTRMSFDAERPLDAAHSCPASQGAVANSLVDVIRVMGWRKRELAEDEVLRVKRSRQGVSSGRTEAFCCHFQWRHQGGGGVGWSGRL